MRKTVLAVVIVGALSIGTGHPVHAESVAANERACMGNARSTAAHLFDLGAIISDLAQTIQPFGQDVSDFARLCE